MFTYLLYHIGKVVLWQTILNGCFIPPPPTQTLPISQPGKAFRSVKEVRFQIIICCLIGLEVIMKCQLNKLYFRTMQCNVMTSSFGKFSTKNFCWKYISGWFKCLFKWFVKGSLAIIYNHSAAAEFITFLLNILNC